ncbi:hypothetical protein ACS5NO_29670 [Larkinella sp. GY13]
MYNEFERVVLTDDLPELGLMRGDRIAEAIDPGQEVGRSGLRIGRDVTCM